MASSFNSSQNTSTSEPVVTRTIENDILDRLSGVAEGLANQMNSWAQGVFQKTSQITDQAVGNFFQVSQKMLGLSDTLTDQYNDVFAPQNASLAKEADSYNSVARQKLNMGAAGATQAQAGDAALRNSEEALRSYGIDPSSGRYAALDKAAAVQNAANVAGAENMQRDRDIATGQRLRSEAVQVGATMPAAIANVNNTAIQANTGASNATLANANTGANLNRLANEYLKTAMDLKMPLSGQKTQSQGSSSGSSSSPDSGGSKGGGGGGSPGGGSPGGGGSGQGGPAWMPQHGDGQPQRGGGGGGGRGITPGTMAGIRHLTPYDQPNSASWNDPSGQDYNPLSGVDPDSFSGQYNPYGEGDPYYQPEEGYGMGVGDPGTNENLWDSNDPYSFNNNNPFDNSDFGQTLPQGGDFGGADQTFGDMSGGTNTEWGNISYDPSANAVDPGWGQTYDQPSSTGTNWGDGADAYAGAGYSAQYQDPGSGGNPSSDYYADYAKGGPIGGATIPQRGQNRHAYKGPRPSFMADGGAVDPAMSPSGGAAIDDVPAQGPPGQPNIRLNADEFVIPDDVAKWKGQEFFQNLIMQSRKKRMGAPAHGQQTPMR